MIIYFHIYNQQPYFYYHDNYLWILLIIYVFHVVLCCNVCFDIMLNIVACVWKIMMINTVILFKKTTRGTIIECHILFKSKTRTLIISGKQLINLFNPFLKHIMSPFCQNMKIINIKYFVWLKSLYKRCIH